MPEPQSKSNYSPSTITSTDLNAKAEASNASPTQPLDRLKTSAFDRRLSIAKASFNIGRRWAGNSVGGLFMSKEARTSRNQAFMQEQADYLVRELGKLKGSVVKIGQMLALYGEHFLPPEITEALHTLNDNTASLAWTVVEQTLRHELGDKLSELEVDPAPIGTASLAQVHRATIIATGEQVVLKVQYPGVADAIDSDLSLFRHLLKVTNAVPQMQVLDAWFLEIKDLLKTEVNYKLEADTTKRFGERLADDERYVVPKVYEAYSTMRVLCLSYEVGEPITQVDMDALSQTRRDALGQAVIDILLNEIFVWGEMQTDPNFGNYLIRLADLEGDASQDKLVLLDFGAMRQFDGKLLSIARGLMIAGYQHDKTAMLSAMHGYEFFDAMNERDKGNMADVFLLATEPFRKTALANQGYRWATSNLHERLMTLSGEAMQTRHFSLPPKEFMFISRKFIGAYTFLTVLDAVTDSEQILQNFVPLG